MLHCPVSIHFCFPLGTVKSCFVSEMVTRADPRTVRISFSYKILKFWATIVTQNFYFLSEKSGRPALTNTFLQTLLCSKDILESGYNQKMLMRKKTLSEFVLIMNSCFIQYNAPLKEYVNVTQ